MALPASSEIIKTPPQGWSPVLMRSLNEPAEEEEDIRGRRRRAARLVFQRCDIQLRAVSQKQRPAVQGSSLAVEDQSWRRQKREPCCWRMQPTFSPLCVVSARITTVEEARRREEREEDGRGERVCDERCIQVDGPLLSHKNRPMSFAPHRTPLMLYSITGNTSVSKTRVKLTHCVYWSICTNTYAPSST